MFKESLIEKLEHIKFLLEECGEHVTPRPFVDECIVIAKQTKSCVNEKHLREDIYNELFDSGRLAMAIPDPHESLDERCYNNTNNIMCHIRGHIHPIEPVSLAKCISAAAEVDKEPFVGYRSIVIAILTIAGVPYVD